MKLDDGRRDGHQTHQRQIGLHEQAHAQVGQEVAEAQVRGPPLGILEAGGRDDDDQRQALKGPIELQLGPRTGR